MVLSKKHYLTFLLILIGFSFGWGLHTVPLFDEKEGFFAEGTREMAVRQDFLTTYVNQQIRFDKPPLTHWLQYLSAQLVGWNETAMRLPSALAALIWISTLYFFVRRRLGDEPAFFATLMATCSIQVTIIGKAALADTLLNATLTGSMFSLYMLLNVRQRPYVWLFYTLTGVGFMIEGPMALLIPVIVVVLYVLRWRAWRSLWQLVDPLGVALFAAIALPWYVVQYNQLGPDFFKGFFLNQNTQQFRSVLEGYYQSLVYYMPILLIGLLPFTGIIFKALTRWRSFWNDRFFSFMLIWFALVFVFFVLSGTTSYHSVLYSYTPLFVLGGWYAYRSNQLPFGWPLLLLLLVLTVIPLLLPSVIPYVEDPYAVAVMQSVAEYFDVYYLAGMVGLLAITEVVDFSRSWDKKLRLLILGLVALIVVNVLWMPRIGALLQQPVKDAALLARQLNPPGILVQNHDTPSFYFYSGLFAEEREARPGDIVFTKKNLLNPLQNVEVLYEKHGMVLVRIRK